MNDRMDIVKDHFDTEAGIFDGRVIKTVPHYLEMLDALVSNIPFDKNASFSAVDMGCGTGTVAYLLKKTFPNAKVRCVDFAANMLSHAREKLKDFEGVIFEQANIAGYDFSAKVDAVVSSLALHHLENDAEKRKFQLKAFGALDPGGCFINADIILASDEKHQSISLEKWKEFNMRHLTPDQIKDRQHKYETEDRPAVLMSELNNLKEIGYKNVDVYWKYYNFAVYGGMK